MLWQSFCRISFDSLIACHVERHACILQNALVVNSNPHMLPEIVCRVSNQYLSTRNYQMQLCHPQADKVDVHDAMHWEGEGNLVCTDLSQE